MPSSAADPDANCRWALAPESTGYSAAIVTFRRPETLATVLKGLAEQQVPPTVVAVADNDPGESARLVVDAVSETTRMTVLHVPVGANLGPAGGWARAVEMLRQRHDRGAWVAVFDDDDPIEHPAVLAELLEHAVAEQPDVAAVGLRGADLRERWATLHRVHPRGRATDVDYLAGGGAPLYRWTAIDELGFFASELFFGFEDLEFGLRLRAAGYRLLVVPSEHHVVSDTAAQRTPWREYYKCRAIATICLRHLGLLPLLATLVRGVLIGGFVLGVRNRRLDLVVARWHGAADALRGSLGPGRYAPTTNPAKSS